MDNVNYFEFKFASNWTYSRPGTQSTSQSNIFGRICVHYFLDVFASTFFSDAFASIFYQIVIWTTQFQPVYICVQITPSLWFWCLFVLQHLKFNQDLFVKLSYVCYTNGRVFYLRESAHQKKRLFGCSKARQKVVSAIMADLTQGKTWEYTKKTPEQILFMCRRAQDTLTLWHFRKWVRTCLRP